MSAHALLRRSGRLRRAALAVGTAAAVGAALWPALAGRQAADDGADPGLQPQLPAVPHDTAPALARSDGAAPSSRPGAAPVAQTFDRWVEQHSALRGSASDGGWGLDLNGRVQPSLALRRRFDHLLQLTGQAPMALITDRLARQAQAELQPGDAETVLRIWHAYLGLLGAPGQADASSAAGEPALAARVALRRQWLGAAWAEAFYAEEEAALARHLAGVGLRPSAGEFIDRAALPPDAVQRLADEEAQQARWRQTLGEARDEVRRLRAAPELSAQLLAAEIDRVVNERFAPGGERLRARALLGLAPG